MINALMRNNLVLGKATEIKHRSALEGFSWLSSIITVVLCINNYLLLYASDDAQSSLFRRK